MYYDQCLECGVTLSPKVSVCPICGYENSLSPDHGIFIDDEFFNEMNDEFNDAFDLDDSLSY